MNSKIRGALFAGLGIALLVPAWPFPDLSLTVVQYPSGTPIWFSRIVVMVLPLCYIIFGMVSIWHKKIGSAMLLAASIGLVIASALAIPHLAIVEFYQPGLESTVGTIEITVVGGAIFFLAIAAYLGYSVLSPNK
ncbi:hypothetical protein QQM79_20650 [Marinobacteraceae bacterium S3BR75-40.1]